MIAFFISPSSTYQYQDRKQGDIRQVLKNTSKVSGLRIVADIINRWRLCFAKRVVRVETRRGIKSVS